jgi:malate/lactate dehydrogenase
MFKVCLVYSSMRLGVPFIAPRQLGAVESNPGRQFLPSVAWRTGQSGVPPDRHCSVSGADCFPKLAQPTVEDLEPLAHRTLSGAHRTVRCSHQTVGSAMRHARIVRSTVGAADRWLTGQSSAPPDSPVNFSRTPPMNS